MSSMADKANDRQVGGSHYKDGEHEEHWDRAWRLNYDPFQYIITKWVERWKKKGGIEDLKKAQHAIQKYIELVEGDGVLARKILNSLPTHNPPDEDAKLFGPKSGSGHKPWTEPAPFKQTGYIGYSYEGGTAEWDLFKCHICKKEVKTAVNGNPAAIHTCTPKDYK